MITAEQIKGARAMLRWSAKILADRAGLSLATIQRMEAARGVPTSSAKNVEIIQHTFEDAGIVFIEEERGRAGPGLRLRDSFR